MLFVSILFCAWLQAGGKMAYWNVQRRGANFFNQVPTEEWFVAAKQVGIQFVRLAPDKWQSEQRDFLLGDADAFERISAADFQALKRTLDWAHAHDIKVVITVLSLPGSRFKDNNHDQIDLRIWQKKEYHAQAAHFWKELAYLLKDHPAVVGYDILNEPHPERASGVGDFRELDVSAWYASVKDSAADLNVFYQHVIQAIREVDSKTPIILETGFWGTPCAITYLTPATDPYLLYSFHMYEPYAYTCRRVNNGRYGYPGMVPIRLNDAEAETDTSPPSLYWDKAMLQEFLSPITAWQEAFQVPSSRILVGEFGCDRMAQGAADYLGGLAQIFDVHGWHWAFYAFREDCWEGMDYELGPDKIPPKYWDAVEARANLDQFRSDNPLFDVIRNALKR